MRVSACALLIEDRMASFEAAALSLSKVTVTETTADSGGLQLLQCLGLDAGQFFA